MPGRLAVNIGKRILLAKTCSVCREFKQGSDFRTTRQGYHPPECKKCHQLRVAARAKVVNRRQMHKVTKKTGTPWTEHDIAKLKVMVADRMGASEIARILDRSIMSVYMAKTRYGILTPEPEEPIGQVPEPEPEEVPKMRQVRRGGVTRWERVA